MKSGSRTLTFHRQTSKISSHTHSQMYKLKQKSYMCICTQMNTHKHTCMYSKTCLQQNQKGSEKSIPYTLHSYQAHFQFFLSFFPSVIFVPVFPVVQYTNVHIIRWLGFLSFPSLTELLVPIHFSGSIQNNKVDQFLMNSHHSFPFLCQISPTYYSQYLIMAHCTFFEPGALWQPLSFMFYFREISLFTTTVYLYSKLHICYHIIQK